MHESTDNTEGGTGLSLLLFRTPLRVISFGRKVLPHSYLADAGPD